MESAHEEFRGSGKNLRGSVKYLKIVGKVGKLCLEKINSFNSINSLYNHYAYKKKTLNILIIDDDENVSTMLEDYLSLRGHYVEIVCEGTRGITKNNLKKYDIIFIDYHLDNDLPPNISKNNFF